jgi:localization factor PodJL
MEKRFTIHMKALQEHANRSHGTADSPDAARSAMPPELARIRERLDRLSQKIGTSSESGRDSDSSEGGSEGVPPEQMARLGEDMHAMRSALERVEAKTRGPDLSSVTNAIRENHAELAAALERIADRSGADDDAKKMSALAERLDNLDRSLSRIAARGESLSGAGMEVVEKRLDELASAILALGETGAAGKVDQRISVLAETIEELVALGKTQSDEIGKPLQNLPNLLQQLDEKLARVGDSLASYAQSAGGEQQQEIVSLIQGLAGRVEEISGSGSGDVDARLAQLDAQLGKIVSQLDTIGAAPDLKPVCDRLDSIDRQLTLSRDVAIDVATQAAEQAVQLAAASAGGGAEAAAAITDKLQKLESKRLEEAQKHQHDFDVLQKTLVAVAERLNLIDEAIREIAAVGVFTPSEAPEIQSETQLASPEPPIEVSGSEPPPVEETPDTRAFALTGPDEAEEDPYQEPESYREVPVDLALTDVVHEEPVEPLGDDVPLEPGSRSPDLTALVRHASERRMAVNAERRDREENAADYLSAARRAAQAAAEAAALSELEAAEEEEKLKAETSKLGSVSDVLKRNKKAVVLAASAIVIAAVAIPTAWYLTSRADLSPVGIQAAMSEDVPAAPETGPMPAAPDTPTAIAAPSAPAMPPVMNDTSDSVVPTATSQEEVPAQEAVASTDTVEKPVQETARTEAAPTPAENEVAAMPAPSVPAPPEQVGNAALRRAAADGDTAAIFEIARRYTDGDGVERNLIEAAKWYEIAAERGYAPAQYRYANFLEKGHGLSVDLSKSAIWYEKAAQQGNAMAMHNLAVLKTSGLLKDGVDLGGAIDWFKRAANLGIKDSQVNLGIIYARGLGTDKDLSQSYKWFAIAAREGDSDAAQKRDTIAASLAQSELETARSEAEMWQPVPLNEDANTPEVTREWESGSDDAAGLGRDGFVAAAQQMLALRGFDPGPADGKMGERTRDAVERFQLQNGMEIDGKVTEELVRRLSGGSA